MSRLDKADNH